MNVLCQRGGQQFRILMCQFNTRGRGRITSADNTGLDAVVAEKKDFQPLEASERASGAGQWLRIAGAVGLIYLVLGALYWFRTPIAGIAVATVCLLAAWLNHVASSPN
jgi:hypothetical protein